MSSFLGFNAGGTKTDCIILDSAGNILGEATGGPANPLRIGFAKACASLGDTAQRTLLAAHQHADDIRAICAGIAGAGRPRVARRIAAYLTRAFPHSVIRVTTDMEIALEAAIGQGQGVVIVAGTGSAACGRNAAGKTARAGGWGPWIGDEGSAYDIGRRAIEAALRARDHLGPASVLGERILLVEQAHDWDTVIERIAKRPDNVFPKLLSVVLEAAAAGDAVAREILSAAAKSLAHLAKCVIADLELTEQSFTLAKSGGVFGRSLEFDALVDRELASVAPTARIVPLRIPPAQVAAELARKSVSSVAAHGA
ncbi:MAG TPA: BadF/BadG/BcrA/BcrD ATPase family protein [Candidatus Acidoferrales bacterium]|nr:BadF/BadG/BcrA/BcrD ATPase family protein [Candidatus Acidoferrales bacterium]